MSGEEVNINKNVRQELMKNPIQSLLAVGGLAVACINVIFLLQLQPLVRNLDHISNRVERLEEIVDKNQPAIDSIPVLNASTLRIESDLIEIKRDVKSLLLQ